MANTEGEGTLGENPAGEGISPNVEPTGDMLDESLMNLFSGEPNEASPEKTDDAAIDMLTDDTAFEGFLGGEIPTPSSEPKPAEAAPSVEERLAQLEQAMEKQDGIIRTQMRRIGALEDEMRRMRAALDRMENVLHRIDEGTISLSGVRNEIAGSFIDNGISTRKPIAQAPTKKRSLAGKILGGIGRGIVKHKKKLLIAAGTIIILGIATLPGKNTTTPNAKPQKPSEPISMPKATPAAMPTQKATPSSEQHAAAGQGLGLVVVDETTGKIVTLDDHLAGTTTPDYVGGKTFGVGTGPVADSNTAAQNTAAGVTDPNDAAAPVIDPNAAAAQGAAMDPNAVLGASAETAAAPAADAPASAHKQRQGGLVGATKKVLSPTAQGVKKAGQRFTKDTQYSQNHPNAGALKKTVHGLGAMTLGPGIDLGKGLGKSAVVILKGTGNAVLGTPVQTPSN